MTSYLTYQLAVIIIITLLNGLFAIGAAQETGIKGWIATEFRGFEHFGTCVYRCQRRKNRLYVPIL
jgi:hypothetical protein